MRRARRILVRARLSCEMKTCSNQSPSRAPRAACVNTWLGETQNFQGKLQDQKHDRNKCLFVLVTILNFCVVSQFYEGTFDGRKFRKMMKLVG